MEIIFFQKNSNLIPGIAKDHVIYWLYMKCVKHGSVQVDGSCFSQISNLASDTGWFLLESLPDLEQVPPCHCGEMAKSIKSRPAWVGAGGHTYRGKMIFQQQ